MPIRKEESKPLSKPLKKIFHKIFQSRIRGKAVTSDFFSEEMPDHIYSFIDSVKETTLISLILFLIVSKGFLSFEGPLGSLPTLFLLFFFPFALFKMCKGAFRGWDKLRRLHRVIQEEQYEIEHHRKNERNELLTLYKAKGFSGKILEEVVDILMSDDNRLLQIMLEEEMGLALGSYEHPLKIAFFSFSGVFISSCLLFLSLAFAPTWLFFLVLTLILIGCVIYVAKYERQNLLQAIFWNLSIWAFVGFVTHLTCQIILNL